ncbi:MAG: hypothetical protein LC803_14795 [Acidobacteria bacterium]|nr:hypothetical protein [Acidobacteriota bacterium]
MRRFILLSTLGLTLLSVVHGQSTETRSINDELSVKKFSLLADLQALEAESFKLEKPLALAVAKAEVAATAWTFDETWAKKLLREAYELTLPPEAEQFKLREKPAGAPPVLPTGDERARAAVRNQVLRVASRDHKFGDELIKLGLEKLGSYETHQRYSQLAYQAAREGDSETAGIYTLKAIETDPTHLGPVQVINEIATRDRAAADKLILQYIDQLRSFPLSYENQSTMRTSFMLNMLVYPRPAFNEQVTNIMPPGVAVMRSYVVYEVERFSKLDETLLRRARAGLLLIWEPLKKYAPDLTRTFMELEARSRMPGDDSPLPTRQSNREQNAERYEKRLKDAFDAGVADETTVNLAIAREDFERARKLIAKLPDGAQKIQFTDIVNTKEAINLAARGDIAGAEHLAEQLTRMVSLLEAYPAIINRCRADKTRVCIPGLLVSKAVRQLKCADSTPTAPPAGIPASVVPSNREFDPLLSGLSKLAGLIAPLDQQLALEVLDEVIAAANSSTLDTTQGRTGLDTELFRRLAPGNEVRVRQSAETLKDRLRRIVALAAVYQGKAAGLAQAAKKPTLN